MPRRLRLATPATTDAHIVFDVPIEMVERTPCPYCENFEGRYASHGPPAVVFENDVVYVFLAPSPLGGMPGHTLVIPKRHVETVLELSPDEEMALARAVFRAARAVNAAFDPDGIRIEQRNGRVAEQTVPHAHFHVIPRRAGTPYPPTTWLDVTPADERALLAQRLRTYWDTV